VFANFEGLQVRTIEDVELIRREFERICRAIGRTELIDDPRYSTPDVRYENAEVVALLDEAFAKKDMAEWKVLFDQHSVIFGPIQTIAGVAADPQMKTNGVFAEFDHPQLGSVPTVNNPINVSGVVKEKPQLAPEIGEHSFEILSGLGYDDEAIRQMLNRGAIAAPDNKT